MTSAYGGDSDTDLELELSSDELDVGYGDGDSDVEPPRVRRRVERQVRSTSKLHLNKRTPQPVNEMLDVQPTMQLIVYHCITVFGFSLK